MIIALNSYDQLKILTLQDNFIDLASRDNTDMVKRARIRPKQWRNPFNNPELCANYRSEALKA